MDNEYRLSARQILTRIISVIVAGVGGSACGFSLLMQVQEIGTIIASITWFSGLLAVVFALSGYAVSCDPGKGKSYIPLAVVIGAVLVITGSALARIYLYAHMVIVIALIAAAVEGVVLIIYHFILKREDPEAL
ncbi:MAG: hypothetical protein ACLU0T_01055 [Bacteroidales bacterium]